LTFDRKIPRDSRAGAPYWRLPRCVVGDYRGFTRRGLGGTVVQLDLSGCARTHSVSWDTAIVLWGGRSANLAQSR
jgi:hypothetical protein